MASLAYILAAATPVPEETDREWFSRYHSWHSLVWEQLMLSGTEEEQELNRRAYRSTSLSGNAADAEHKGDPEIQRLADEWIANTYPQWVAAGRPDPAPTNDVADYGRISGEETRLGLSTLIHYRDGFKQVARGKLPKGATHAFLANVSDTYRFALVGESDSTELKILREICRRYGGQYLAIWTFGHSVTIWHASSPEPGKEPGITVADFRLFAPCGRSRGGIERLRSAMKAGPLQPDFGALQKELEVEAISVTAWYRAFGLEGANEIVLTDHGDVWVRFEAAARQLLSGEAADAKQLRELNRLIEPIDDEAKLKSRPNKRAGRTAANVVMAGSALREAVGWPDDDVWQERLRAARTIWDIGEGPAGDQLETMDSPFGLAAGLGRLLGHYPPALARDALFHPLAAFEAEAANAHGFVEPLYILAETAKTVGFTLAIYPGDADESFRKSMKVAGGPDEPGEWAAQAFIDLPKAEPAKVLAALEKWYAKERADGLVLRAEADGSFRLLRFEAGASREEAPADAGAVADAARRLVPRDAFRGLGHADLLEPGEWTEGAYAGDAQSPDADRAKAVKALAGDAKTIEVSTPRDLAQHFGAAIGGVEESVAGRKWKTYFLALRLCPACDDAGELQRLRSDLAALEDMMAWVDAGCVVACTHFSYPYSGVDTHLLAAIIADLPAGTSVRVAGRGGVAEVRVGAK